MLYMRLYAIVECVEEYVGCIYQCGPEMDKLYRDPNRNSWTYKDGDMSMLQLEEVVEYYD